MGLGDVEAERDLECSAEREVGGHVWLGGSGSEGVPKAEQHHTAWGKTWS